MSDFPYGIFMAWNRIGRPVLMVNGWMLTSRESLRILNAMLRARS